MSLFAKGVLDGLDAADLSEQTDEVQLIHSRTCSLEEAARRVELSPILKRYGTWAVTEYGVECLATYYAISKEVLNRDDWLGHMRGKSWIEFEDFRDALACAQRVLVVSVKVPATATSPASIRERHRRRLGLSNSLKFAVMKRDGYRCQLCGRTAADGTQLDIDHKVALANGGSNHLDNLWVLCQPCNNGKGVNSL